MPCLAVLNTVPHLPPRFAYIFGNCWHLYDEAKPPLFRNHSMTLYGRLTKGPNKHLQPTFVGLSYMSYIYNLVEEIVLSGESYHKFCIADCAQRCSSLALGCNRACEDYYVLYLFILPDTYLCSLSPDEVPNMPPNARAAREKLSLIMAS